MQTAALHIVGDTLAISWLCMLATVFFDDHFVVVVLHGLKVPG